MGYKSPFICRSWKSMSLHVIYTNARYYTHRSGLFVAFTMGTSLPSSANHNFPGIAMVILCLNMVFFISYIVTQNVFHFTTYFKEQLYCIYLILITLMIFTKIFLVGNISPVSIFSILLGLDLGTLTWLCISMTHCTFISIEIYTEFVPYILFGLSIATQHSNISSQFFLHHICQKNLV